MSGRELRGRYLDDLGDRLRVRPSMEDTLGDAVLLAFALAPGILLACSGTGAILDEGDGRSFWLGWGLGALLSAPLALFGLVRAASARRFCGQGAVTLDLAERLIRRGSAAPSVLGGVVAVRAAKGRWPGAGHTLSLVHEDGRATVLLRRARDGRLVSSAADAIAEALEVDLDVPLTVCRARPLLPRESHAAGALCYVPIDGLLVAASLFYLTTSRDSFARFSAKQSLLGCAFEACAAVAILCSCGLPTGVLFSEGVAAASVSVPLFALALARVLVRTLAAQRAYRGVVWIQPWLGPIARRWAPRRVM